MRQRYSCPPTATTPNAIGFHHVLSLSPMFFTVPTYRRDQALLMKRAIERAALPLAVALALFSAGPAGAQNPPSPAGWGGFSGRAAGNPLDPRLLHNPSPPPPTAPPLPPP